MLTIENLKVFNLEGALRGMRFPMQSNSKSDSEWNYAYAGFPDEDYIIGDNDMALAQKLIKAGEPHSKFMRQILVSMDITAPLYWWKEMDTYKVATVANSESTMHKLASTPITVKNFSFDDELRELPLYDREPYQLDILYEDAVANLIEDLETLRKRYFETKDKRYWRALIQLLPTSWNQKRHWTGNYAGLLSLVHSREGHKLTEWAQFIDVLKEKAPYFKEFLEV